MAIKQCTLLYPNVGGVTIGPIAADDIIVVIALLPFPSSIPFFLGVLVLEEKDLLYPWGVPKKQVLISNNNSNSRVVDCNNAMKVEEKNSECVGVFFFHPPLKKLL